MGLARNVMEGLIREHQHRPFSGTAYTLGRQTMATKPDRTNFLFDSLGAVPVGGTAREGDIDIVTSFSGQLGYGPVRDDVFFRMLGFSGLKAIDVDGAEGAEIILDSSLTAARSTTCSIPLRRC